MKTGPFMLLADAVTPKFVGHDANILSAMTPIFFGGEGAHRPLRTPELRGARPP